MPFQDLVEHTIPFSIGKRVCAGEGINGQNIVLTPFGYFLHWDKIKPSEKGVGERKDSPQCIVRRVRVGGMGEGRGDGDSEEAYCYSGMARVELFLGLTATFQHFKITSRPEETIDLVSLPGPIRMPKPQKLRIEKVL